MFFINTNIMLLSNKETGKYGKLDINNFMTLLTPTYD